MIMKNEEMISKKDKWNNDENNNERMMIIMIIMKIIMKMKVTMKAEEIMIIIIKIMKWCQ